jgi:hypothetical protein
MELTALVKYNGALAEYQINEVGSGVYNAILRRYTGDVHCPPSSYIILKKSVEQWIASIFEPKFIKRLGRIIERSLSRTSRK